MLDLSSASPAKPRSFSAVLFRVALLINMVWLNRTFGRTNAKHGQIGHLWYNAAACANAYGNNSRYVTASELIQASFDEQSKGHSKVECIETLQEISSHMRAPPAAWERETCGHEGEIKER